MTSESSATALTGDRSAAASLGATPRPWRIDDAEPGELWISDLARKSCVCMVTASGHVTERDKADAELIVRAVNNFDKMLVALINISVIARQNCNDLCATLQEGGKLNAVDKMEFARWQSVLQAIDDATSAASDHQSDDR